MKGPSPLRMTLDNGRNWGGDWCHSIGCAIYLPPMFLRAQAMEFLAGPSKRTKAA
jgi:hypothetical protein